MEEQWNIGEPGGPAGPFYSIVSSTGRVIALQIPDRETAERICKLPELETRAIELETQLVPLQQQFDDWAEQNRCARAWAAAWKRAAKENKYAYDVMSKVRREEWEKYNKITGDLEDTIDQAQDEIDALKAANAVLTRMLEGLTPGSSEFAGSPSRCFEFAKDRMETAGKIAADNAYFKQRNAELLHDVARLFKHRATLVRYVRELREANADLAAVNDKEIKELRSLVDVAESEWQKFVAMTHDEQIAELEQNIADAVADAERFKQERDEWERKSKNNGLAAAIGLERLQELQPKYERLLRTVEELKTEKKLLRDRLEDEAKRVLTNAKIAGNLESENARLRDIIRKCEWTNVPLQLEDEPDYEDWCPWCLFGPEHDEDCELKAELERTPWGLTSHTCTFMTRRGNGYS